MNIVIIGNSAAAVGCIEAVRGRDKDSAITLLAAEPFHTYGRPLISYLLAGKTDEARMRYRPESFYTDNKVTARLGETVESIDPEAKTVRLESGEAVPYDKLLVATGSAPAIPPIEGLEGVEQRTGFMTLDDARYLAKTVRKKSRVLIMGAGLIGLKCAEGLHGRAGSITVVDLADHILPSVLDADAAKRVEEHLRAQEGLDLKLSRSVRRFPDPTTAELSDGSRIEFDVLVVAVGVRPNTALVSDAGGTVERGIVCDEFQRTGLPDVYAAGDCTLSHDVSAGVDRILAVLPGAHSQGRTAGLHMTGEEKPYDKAIPLNALGLFGLHMVTAGSYTGEEHRVIGEGCYKRLFVEGGLLKGFMIIGDVSRAGIYTALVRERTPLESVDFDLILDRPQLMAFSRPERAKKLGGVRV